MDGETIAGIDRGLLVFLGVYPTDGTAEVEWIAEKVLRLRVFADTAGLMNASVMDVAGGVLVHLLATGLVTTLASLSISYASGRWGWW